MDIRRKVLSELENGPATTHTLAAVLDTDYEKVRYVCGLLRDFGCVDVVKEQKVPGECGRPGNLWRLK